MSTKYKLTLHTKLATQICQLKIFKKPNKALFDLMIYKIAKLLYLANQRSAYSYLALLQVKSTLSTETKRLDEEMEKYRSAIVNRGVNLNCILQDVLYEKTVLIENPIIFDFVILVQKFDRLINLMHLSRNVGVFLQQNTYLRLSHKRKKSFQKTLTSIIQISTQKIPKVTIEEYIGDSDQYMQASQLYGAIDPSDLFNAVSLAATPLMKAKEMNQLKHALKKRISDRKPSLHCEENDSGMAR